LIVSFEVHERDGGIGNHRPGSVGHSSNNVGCGQLCESSPGTENQEHEQDDQLSGCPIDVLALACAAFQVLHFLDHVFSHLKAIQSLDDELAARSG
jgi:hypothetical protein